MKAYFIGGAYEACYYVRSYLPLVAGGWDGDKTSMRKPRSSAEAMMKGAMNADVVIFHRPLAKDLYEAAKLLKISGKKIVMDNDDTYRKDSGVPVNMFGGLKDKLNKAVEGIDINLKKFAEISDLVTVSTPTLAEEYREVNKNVVILPNCVEPFDWDEPVKNQTGKIRIGIVGSVASNKDYQVIIPLLDELNKRDDVQLVLFALPAKVKETEIAQEIYKPEYQFWNKYNIEWHPFVPIYEYNDKLINLSLDIMLIPRYDSYFNRAKSNVKFLEATMAGTAVIAQGFADGLSPYQQDEPYCVIAYDEKDWTEKTLDLIANTEKRDILISKAREYVLSKYDINKNISLWEQAYANIK